MRQLKPSTNLVLAVLAGLGLLASLGLPWYAAPVADTTVTDGPVERFAFQVAQVFATSAKGTVTGSAGLGDARVALIAVVAVIALVAVAVGMPAIRRQSEDLMRVVAVAAPLVVIVAAVAHPGATQPVRIHYGLLVSLALVALMVNAAWHGANLREKRAAPTRPRYGKA